MSMNYSLGHWERVPDHDVRSGPPAPPGLGGLQEISREALGDVFEAAGGDDDDGSEAEAVDAHRKPVPLGRQRRRSLVLVLHPCHDGGLETSLGKKKAPLLCIFEVCKGPKAPPLMEQIRFRSAASSTSLATLQQQQLISIFPGLYVSASGIITASISPLFRLPQAASAFAAVFFFSFLVLLLPESSLSHHQQ